MAVGRLNSVKTTTVQVNKNLEIYTSQNFADDVSIFITNQGIERAKFTVGLTTTGISNVQESDYIILGQELNPRESTSVTNVGISSGNTLFCRASKPDVGFVAFSVGAYSGTGLGYGKENSLILDTTTNPTNQNLLLATVPDDSNLTISVNNRSFKDASFSIGISDGGLNDFSSSDFLVFGQPLPQGQSFILKDIVLAEDQSLIIRGTEPGLVFSVNSLPAVAPGGVGAGGSSLTVINQTTVLNVSGVGSTALGVTFATANTGNTAVLRDPSGNFYAGIVTTSALYAGEVVGNVTGNVTGNINSVGVSTFNSVVVGGANTALVVTGNINVSGTSTVNNLVVNGSLSGPGVEAAVIAYSIAFGS